MNFKNNYINSFIAKAIEVIEKLKNLFTSYFTLEYSGEIRRHVLKPIIWGNSLING